MTLSGVETITIHRREQVDVDAHGNPVYERTEVVIGNCLVGFGSTNEPSLVDGDPVDSNVTLYLPHNAEVFDGDEFEIRGELWVKDGDPHAWVSPFAGFDPGVVVQVRRRRG